MRCIRVIPAKSTPEASNQTADAEDIEEEETSILLKGRTNMRQIREADNQVDPLALQRGLLKCERADRDWHKPSVNCCKIKPKTIEVALHLARELNCMDDEE
jgi:hypothetical protein